MPRYRSIPRGAILVDLPNTFQLEGHTCGPAALMAICAYYGVGPEEEWDVEADMRIDDSGSDPAHLIRAATKYGLSYREYRTMTLAQLFANLRRHRPVMVMLQAWGDRDSYRDVWTEGHWVVAIGHDRKRVYFEDPSIYRGRGFLTHAELDARWHDVEGRDNHHVDHYGLAIWKSRVVRSQFPYRARRIE